MAEWLGRALQKLVQRFESASDLFQMIPRQRDFFCLLLQAELAQSRKEQAKKKPSAGRIIWKFAPPLTGSTCIGEIIRYLLVERTQN